MTTTPAIANQEMLQQVCGLSERLIALERENQALRSQLERFEEEHARFLNLIVASQRLSAAQSAREILSSLNEIIINLIGSEQFGLFFVTRSSDKPLELVCEVFQEGGDLQEAPPFDHRKVQEALETGKVYADINSEGSPAAIIPLRMNQTSLGALILYSVLPHKSGFTKTDLELFEWLACNAARAFYASLMQSAQGLPKDLPELLKTSLCSDSRFQ